jgi:hypothetical protein
VDSPISSLPISGSATLSQNGEMFTVILSLNRVMTFTLQIAY